MRVVRIACSVPPARVLAGGAVQTISTRKEIKVMIKKKIRCIYGGCYEKRKIQYYDRALKYKPYAQAGVCVVDADTIELVSYESPIIRYNTSNRTIEFYRVAPYCSRSTINHVSAFCAEYIKGFSYQDIKALFKADCDGMWQLSKLYDFAVNLHTGEVIEFKR